MQDSNRFSTVDSRTSLFGNLISDIKTSTTVVVKYENFISIYVVYISSIKSLERISTSTVTASAQARRTTTINGQAGNVTNRRRDDTSHINVPFHSHMFE